MRLDEVTNIASEEEESEVSAKNTGAFANREETP